MLMTALNLTQEAELCKSYLYKTTIHVFEWIISAAVFIWSKIQYKLYYMKYYYNLK